MAATLGPGTDFGGTISGMKGRHGSTAYAWETHFVLKFSYFSIYYLTRDLHRKLGL